MNDFTELHLDEEKPVTNSNVAIFNPKNLAAIQQFAQVMASGVSTIPRHLQGNVADCMAITMQAAQWRMNPFAVAQKTHTVNGVLGYEAQLVNAVITTRGPMQDRINYDWFGPWEKVIGKFDIRKNDKGQEYRTPRWKLIDEEGIGVRVWATLKGEDQPRELVLLLAQARTRNSTLWADDPRQQLAYLAVKRWARLYCPEVILGVYTPDEFDQPQRVERDVTPPRSRSQLNNLINNKPEPQESEREINPATNTSASTRTPDQLLADFTEEAGKAESIDHLDKCYKYASKLLAQQNELLDQATNTYLNHKSRLEEAGA
ncbi:recombinase RecT [Pantoea rodasii]|uniref:Recombinase RecT n=1 Tax=Pantoea rodasii TaxID=1076549 RepID=A0A2M9WIC6_9GAMM|nr:RecT family recombinase [Pantoea rodasii]ORM64196.1 recombinase RecT [Pantoea rodasii]PJZ07322.1 recombinase RecT [Pantoea rodasii]